MKIPIALAALAATLFGFEQTIPAQQTLLIRAGISIESVAVRQHKVIFRAISNKDSKCACEAMRSHLNTVGLGVENAKRRSKPRPSEK